ncbi:MAG TPA: permease-like cell division protein FtsX [Bacteroidales bacterium]|nr:permease-like cell division protein FtsX [Bacteroidales bacterium]HPS96319.1 permease-like cell division protein FtsX [Bacteroidales bacterium]
MKRRENKIVVRRLIQSYLSSVISITLVLLLVGIGGVLAVNAKSVSDYFKENIRLSVIFEQNTTEVQARQTMNLLKGKPYVKELKFISKEQGAQEMKSVLGDDFMDVFDLNPIPLSIDMYVRSDYVESDSLSKIKSEILLNPGIKEVVFQESLIETISGNIEQIGIILIVFIVLLLFISFVLINNTVRLNVFSKRFNIHTMKLVGAKKSFIRKPFLIQGIYQGLISGIIAASLLCFLLFLLERDFQQIYQMLDINLIMAVCAGVVVTGILLCLISTYLVVNRLLSLPQDELYY